MDEEQAFWIADTWPGGRGLVPRGPRWVLGWHPADPSDVLRHTGRRAPGGADIWCVEVGGRFLRAEALVYPGGVPYPEEIAGRTAIVSAEAWLYVDADSERLLGVYAWPEAVRRPVASVPRADNEPSDFVGIDEASAVLDFDLRIGAHPDYELVGVVVETPQRALALLAQRTIPDPLNEMLLYENGGLTLRVRACDASPYGGLVDRASPPYRNVGRQDMVGREPGRTLGPQTWPWPGELFWFDDGLARELRGNLSLQELVDVARALGRA